ncbi:MAG: FkbM family methyltransferase [Micromonosporaceae bacterium]
MENTDGERDGAVKQAAEQGGRVEELTRQVARLEARLRESHHKLARAESRLASMEASNSLRFGRAVADALHHPGRGLISVPKELARMWRARRRGEDRVVPIALPVRQSTAQSAARTRELITMTLPSDLRVPRRLGYHGLAGYEPEGLACFLAAADVAGPGAVLDIGANVGIYAALAAALTGREVRAFEPMPSLVDAARRFAAENQLRYGTELLALGAKNGSARLYLSSNSDTSNSLAAGFRDSSSQIEVPVETLDSYAARTGMVPAVMKVDTETTEPDVLAGAAATIREHRPWILCEVLAGRVEDRLTEVLAPFGYHWYHVTGEIPYEPADKIAGDETYTNLMWLFAPEEPGEAFWAALREWVAALAECTPERGAELRSREAAASPQRRTGS